MTIALEDTPDTPTTTTTTATASPASQTSPRVPAARTVGRRGRRLPRRLHQAVLVTHVLASVGWFGVAMTVAFCAFVGSSTNDLAFYEVIDSTLSLSIPLGLAAALTGVVLSLTTRWGLVQHWWVVIKEAIAIAAIATDVLVVGPAMAKAVETGTPGEIPGPIWAHCVVLAIATVLSVVKPRARTPLAAR